MVAAPHTGQQSGTAPSKKCIKMEMSRQPSIEDTPAECLHHAIHPHTGWSWKPSNSALLRSCTAPGHHHSSSEKQRPAVVRNAPAQASGVASTDCSMPQPLDEGSAMNQARQDHSSSTKTKSTTTIACCPQARTAASRRQQSPAWPQQMQRDAPSGLAYPVQRLLDMDATTTAQHPRQNLFNHADSNHED